MYRKSSEYTEICVYFVQHSLVYDYIIHYMAYIVRCGMYDIVLSCDVYNSTLRLLILGVQMQLGRQVMGGVAGGKKVRKSHIQLGRDSHSCS